jgi:hypothetical protein
VGVESYDLSDGRMSDVDLGFLDDAGEDPLSRLFLSTYGDKQWIVNNSTFSDYSRRAYIGGSTSGLSRLVDERLGDSEGAVGLDLAAGTEARALRDLMDSGILEQALATNYRARVTRRLRRNNLDHIRGNLTSRETWQKILGWKDRHAPEGFDLVMHRPVGGLQDLDPRMYQAAGRILFGMVKPGGMMFSQVPRRVMNVEGGLRSLCQSIREGGEVERVVTTGQRPSHIHPSKDERDFYAVVLKKD